MHVVVFSELNGGESRPALADLRSSLESTMRSSAASLLACILAKLCMIQPHQVWAWAPRQVITSNCNLPLHLCSTPTASGSDCTVSLAGLSPRPMTFPDLSGHETEWPWLLPPHMHIGPCRPVCEEAISMHRKKQVFEAAPVVDHYQKTLFNGLLTTIQPAWDQCTCFTHANKTRLQLLLHHLPRLTDLLLSTFWFDCTFESWSCTGLGVKSNWFALHCLRLLHCWNENWSNVLPIGRGFLNTLATNSHRGVWQFHRESRSILNPVNRDCSQRIES